MKKSVYDHMKELKELIEKKNLSKEEVEKIEKELHTNRLKTDPEYRKFKKQEKKLADDFHENHKREQEDRQLIIQTVVITFFVVAILFAIFK